MTKRGLRRAVPIPDWVSGYRREWLRPDAIAGLTTAAVAIPKAMAYATVAGLPVQVGLYTAFLPMLIYALVGTSRPLSVTSTTTIAILAAAELDGMPRDLASLLAASAMLTLLVGGILVLAAILRLGFIANFISEPVLVGFKAGIGLVIVLDQVPKLLGVHFPKGSFAHNLLAVVQSIPAASMLTLTVGIAVIALLVGLERFAPWLPAPLIAVAAAIAAERLLGLGARGVQLVGHIPEGLPPLTWPDASLAGALWPGALAIALMSFTETIAVGRAFATSGEPPLGPNRELGATGLGNAASAFLGAMPSGGGASQTAVNRLAGARTQLAELVTAGVTLVTMLFLGSLLGSMPEATLAAVVIVYSVGLIAPAEFRAILAVRRTEFYWALASLVGVILLGTLQGIVVAIAVSLVAIAYQAAHPPVRVLGRKPGTNVFRPLSPEHPEDETLPGLLLLGVEGRVFFFNAEHVGEQVRPLVDRAAPSVVVLDLSSVPDLEYTALKMLTQAEARYRERGIRLWLVGLTPSVLEMVRRSPLGETLGRERMLFTLELAVAEYQASSAATSPRPQEGKRGHERPPQPHGRG